jgi:hypothetical protein
MDATSQQAIDQSQVTLTDADVTTLTTPEKKAVLDYLELSRLLQEKKIFTGQDDATKLKILQEVATKIIAFVNLLATKKDAVMQYSNTIPTETVGIMGFRKQVPSLKAIEEIYDQLPQSGGADEMIFSKMYNTQGLIEDNNDPIQNALSYNNTSEQIPQPFSSGSSGAAAYTSGIDPRFLQDVLPVLGMTGGDKKKSKSKRNRK